MKIYVAGKITGLDNYKEIFAEVEAELLELGHEIMNPAVLPAGFEWDEYMHICFAMIDVCEALFMIGNWVDSVGATNEHLYAEANKKYIMYDKCLVRPIKVLTPPTKGLRSKVSTVDEWLSDDIRKDVIGIANTISPSKLASDTRIFNIGDKQLVDITNKFTRAEIIKD